MMVFVIIVIIISPIIMIWSLQTKEVYGETFWWETNNGLDYSRAILCKIKGLPIYFIEYDVRCSHPKEHPNYRKFMIKVKKLKS